MTDGVHTLIYPVTDLAAAKKVFGTLLGAGPVMDALYYVQYRVGDDAHGQDVGLDPNGHREAAPGPIAYWHVDDVAKRVTALVEAGGSVLQDVRDVGGGRLVALVTDPDGNVLGLLQPQAG